MFDNDIFEKWLDGKSEDIVEKMGQGEQLRTEEMMVLVLKAQSNHFYHLDRDLRGEMIAVRDDLQGEMKTLRDDLQGEMKTLRDDLQGEMKALRGDLHREIKILREDMTIRFESADKRFEDMNKRFEDTNKRFDDMNRHFEQLMRRVDRFMFWSLGITAAAVVFVVNYLK